MGSRFTADDEVRVAEEPAVEERGLEHHRGTPAQGCLGLGHGTATDAGRDVDERRTFDLDDGAGRAQPVEHASLVGVTQLAGAHEHGVLGRRGGVNASQFRVEAPEQCPLAGGCGAEVARGIDNGGRA